MALLRPVAGFSPICKAVFVHTAHWASDDAEIKNNTKNKTAI